MSARMPFDETVQRLREVLYVWEIKLHIIKIKSFNLFKKKRELRRGSTFRSYCGRGPFAPKIHTFSIIC